MKDYEEWDTYRTRCGRGRASFHGEWSASRPWTLYWDGTAVASAASIGDASSWFYDKRRATLLTAAAGRGNLRPVTVAPVGPGARESE